MLVKVHLNNKGSLLVHPSRWNDFWQDHFKNIPPVLPQDATVVLLGDDGGIDAYEDTKDVWYQNTEGHYKPMNSKLVEGLWNKLTDRMIEEK